MILRLLYLNQWNPSTKWLNSFPYLCFPCTFSALLNLLENTRFLFLCLPFKINLGKFLIALLLGSKQKRQSFCLEAILLASASARDKHGAESVATGTGLSKEKACLSLPHTSVTPKARLENRSCLCPGPAVHHLSTRHPACYSRTCFQECLIILPTAKQPGSLDPTVKPVMSFSLVSNPHY